MLPVIWSWMSEPTNHRLDALPLTQIGGFTLLERLGQGAAGEVVRAERAGVLAAVKLVHRSQSRFFHRLTSEVTALSAVSDPRVVTLLGGGEEGDWAWLAMELVEGRTLTRWLEDQPAGARLKAILHLSGELALGLAAVHEAGFVHQDVKPDNILVDAVGRLCLIDFGFSRRIDLRPGDPISGPITGTPRYMAPEQLTGMEVDSRADLFALGVVIYELLTGQPPFAGPDLAHLVLAVCTATPPPLADLAPSAPPEVVALVERLLEKAPADRPRSAREVAWVLCRAAGEPAQPLPWRPRALTSRWVGDRGPLRLLRDRTLNAERATVIVHGPPGIGLSRALSELRGEVLLRGGRQVLLSGRPDILSAVLEALVGPLIPIATRRHLLGDDRGFLFEAVPSLNQGEPEDDDEEEGPTHQVRSAISRLQAATGRVVRRAVAQRPLLIAIDDAERVDPADLAALHGNAMLVLASHQPDRIRLPAERIALRSLTPGQLAEMARSMIDDAGPELAWSHSGELAGNPAALVRLARAWAERQAPRTPAAPREHRGDVAWETAVTEAEQALLEHGPADASAWLARPSGAAPGSGPLRHRIEITRARIAFQLGRDADCLAHAARAAEVAATLAERHSARMESARCALRQGRYAACADEARAGFTDAITADELEGRAEGALRWAVLLARAQAGLGRWNDADRDLREAQRFTTSAAAPTPRRFDLAWMEATITVALCRWAEAERPIRDLLTHSAGKRDSRGKVGAQHLMGLIHLRQGQIRLALSRLEAAAALSDRLDDPELHCGVLADLSVVQAIVGHPEGSRASLQAAWALLRRRPGRAVAVQVLRAGLFSAATYGDREALSVWLDRRGSVPAEWLDPVASPMLHGEIGLALTLIGDREGAAAVIGSLDTADLEDPHDALLLRIRLAEARLRLEVALPGDLSAELVVAHRYNLVHLQRLLYGLALKSNRPIPDLERRCKEADQDGDAWGHARLRGRWTPEVPSAARTHAAEEEDTTDNLPLQARSPASEGDLSPRRTERRR